MILIDESVPEHQISLLRNWRLHVRVVGVEIARLGIKDDDLVPVLHELPRPTFFTLDDDFYRRRYCHAGYCVGYVDTAAKFAAEHIRRFLKHPGFDTQAKRMGAVVRIRPAGLNFWRLHDPEEVSAPWPQE